MLDKTDYYHGAAIVKLLEDSRCASVQKKGLLGYVINGDSFVLLKYTTKARSPWGFSFDQEDIDRCLKMASEYRRVILGFICGGDGVCALDWSQAKELLAEKPGRIAAGRKHNKQYEVWGTEGELKGKIPLNRWPSLLFESGTETSDNVSNAVYVAISN